MESLKIISFIILFVIFIFLCFVLTSKFMDNVHPYVSNFDGKNYSVRKDQDMQTMQTAANYLSIINSKIDELVGYMNTHDLPDRDIAKRLYHRWLNCELKETNSNEKTAAYTLNKSTEIRLCIRNSDGNFENINTSMFVVLHELAHVMSVSYGHNDEFKNNFTYITHLASNLGIYKPEDFDNNPKTYCGVTINSTPCGGTSNTCEYNTIKI